jgi:hypothetical protein
MRPLGIAAAALAKILYIKNPFLRKQPTILSTQQRLPRSLSNHPKKRLMNMKFDIILGEHGVNVVFAALPLMTLIIEFKTELVLSLP